MEDVIWVFDMDGTLVDSKQNRVELMMNEKSPTELGLGIVSYFSKTYDFFQSLKEQGIPVMILTARHPFFNELIQYVFNIDTVVCRDYCLDLDDIKIAYEQINEKRQFYNNMLDYKCKVLNALSRRYKHVMFIDDYATEFKKRKTIESPFGVGGTTTIPLVNSNVYPLLPFHVTDGGHTFNGAIEYFKDTGQIR